MDWLEMRVSLGHPSAFPLRHARRTPSLMDPGRGGDGPSAKDSIRFRARI